MSKLSRGLLEETITVWQPFSSSLLSHEDVRKITENIIELFSLLSEWENKYGERNENNKEKE